MAKKLMPWICDLKYMAIVLFLNVIFRMMMMMAMMMMMMMMIWKILAIWI